MTFAKNRRNNYVYNLVSLNTLGLNQTNRRIFVLYKNKRDKTIKSFLRKKFKKNRVRYKIFNKTLLQIEYFSVFESKFLI
uniref:Uncharacterized protein n=1 Tax=Amorphochlora amoebiformis TaxID=1561963 RepID=A0A0H5BLZ5_9EUKA|nr:hypothetical protein [Amorphochlora amoebiformis]